MNQWRRCRCQNVQWMNSFRHSHPPECGWGTSTHWGSIKEKKYRSYEQVRRIDDWSWSSDFGGGRHAADVVLIDIETNKIIPFFKEDSLLLDDGVDWLYFISMHTSASIHCISRRWLDPVKFKYSLINQCIQYICIECIECIECIYLLRNISISLRPVQHTKQYSTIQCSAVQWRVCALQSIIFHLSAFSCPSFP